MNAVTEIPHLCSTIIRNGAHIDAASKSDTPGADIRSFATQRPIRSVSQLDQSHMTECTFAVTMIAFVASDFVLSLTTIASAVTEFAAECIALFSVL